MKTLPGSHFLWLFILNSLFIEVSVSPTSKSDCPLAVMQLAFNPGSTQLTNNPFQLISSPRLLSRCQKLSAQLHWLALKPTIERWSFLANPIYHHVPLVSIIVSAWHQQRHDLCSSWLLTPWNLWLCLTSTSQRNFREDEKRNRQQMLKKNTVKICSKWLKKCFYSGRLCSELISPYWKKGSYCSSLYLCENTTKWVALCLSA